MRVIVFALLLANLLYLGWAELIDVPAPPQTSSIAGLPHLVLARELPPEKRAALAQKMSAPAPAPQCVSVGPFDDPAIVAKAAALLKAKSFAPQQRAAELPVRRFWVYLDGFGSDAAVTGALHKLERKGIDDAEVMPPETGGRRISLGLFTDQTRADRRVKLVSGMGFKPAIGQRMLPGTVYWLDVTLPNGSPPVPLKDVSDLVPAPGPGGDSSAGAPIGVQSCPAGGAPATPPATPSPSPAAPGPQKASKPSAPVSAATLPECKPGGGGPVPCVVLKEAKQPSVL